MTQPLNPMLDLAQSYAAKGWPVFPCRAADDFDPETGEVLPEKAPLISNGFRGATTNERVIRELWKRNPGAVIGIPTGERTGVWVLDLDIKSNANGHEWLAAQEEHHGALPISARVRTANGGTHIFFQHVEGVRNRGGLGHGVDVRGEGGFVIAGGSVMADGRFYEWLDGTGPGTIEDAPQWLLDLVLPPPMEHRQTDWDYTSQSNDRYVSRAIDAELTELASTQPGNRGYQLNASAFSLGQLVGAGAVDRGDVEHGLYSAALACGAVAKDGERETRAKIRRGLDAGIMHPREIPEPSYDREDNTRLVDVKAMIATGMAKAGTTDEQPTEWGSAPPSTQAPQPAPTTTPSAPSPSAAPPSTEDSAITATPFSWIDPSTIPRREFAFGTHYIRKYVSVTVSPGGLGKTSNSVVEVLAMASGKPLNGTKPPQRMRVWLFNAEDPRDEMERRIMAACRHFRLKPEDIEGHLFLDTGREQELVVAIDDKRGVKIQAPVVEAVVEQIKRNRIDVMIVDPFVSTHRVNENDNGAIDRVAKLWAQIADDTNCAIDIVHHLRKARDEKESTVEDARGAVSLIGAARSVRVLNRMTPDEATKAAIAPAERFGYFSITYGKSNLTPLSHRLDWRRLQSVPLGNGGKGNMASLRQDFAPVVTAWQWPSAEQMVEDIPQDIVALLRARVAGQTCTYSYQSKEWVGQVVADVLGIELPEGRKKTPEHAKIERMVDAWIEEGVLVKDEVRGVDVKHPARITTYVRAG